MQATLPDAVSWDELLEETSHDPELKGLKNAKTIFCMKKSSQ